MVKPDEQGRPAYHWILFDQMARLTGYPLQRFTEDATFWQTLIHPEDCPHALEALAQLATLDSIETEYRLTTAGGDEIWVRDSRSVRHDSGQPPLVYGVISDITQHKQAEEALHRANRAYRALSDCNQTMVRATDEMGLFNDICATIVRSGGYRMAWVGYPSSEPGVPLAPVAWAGHEAGFFAAASFEIPASPGHTCPTAQALSTMQPAIVRDIAHADGIPWQAEALQRDYRSAIILPLAMDGDPLGALTVYASEPDAFDPEEVALLGELAGDLSYGIAALRNRRERELAEERLRQSEYNIRTLIENTREAIWSLDRDLHLVTRNEQFCDLIERLFGFVPQIGMSNLVFLQDDERRLWAAAYRRALDGEQFTIERTYSLEAEQITVEVTLNPILSDAGDVTGIVLFARDVTERNRKEAALHELNARLLKHNRELIALNQAGRELTATLDPQTIYRVLYRSVAWRLFAAPHFVVALYDDARRTVTCAYAVLDGEEVDPARFAPLPLGEGPYSATILSRKPRVVDHPAQDTDATRRGFFVQAGSDTGPLSAIYVPMISSDQVIGVISVQKAGAGAFDEADITLLSIAANQAANTIHNASLYDAAQRHATELEAQAHRLSLVNRVATRLAQTLELPEIYDIALTELAAILKTSFSGLLLFEDAEMGRLVADTHPSLAGKLEVTIPVKDNPSIEVVRRTHKPLVSEDVLNDPAFAPAWDALRARGTRSLIIAPLVVGSEVIGTLGMDSTELRTFSPTEIELTETIANQVSLAIAKARLYEAEREQRALAEALRDTAGAMNSTLNFDEVLDRILSNIGRVVPHDAANIMLVEKDKVRIVRGHGYAGFGSGNYVANWVFSLEDRPIIQQVLETGEGYAVQDRLNDPNWIDVPEDRWIRASLKVPIRSDNEIIGILNLDNANPGTFTSDDYERLQAFIDQAAVAIQNARLFAAEREQRALAETLRDTASLINRSLELDDVLERILENVGRVVPHDAANIMFIEDGVARVVRSRGFAERGLGEWIKGLRYVAADVKIWQHMLATGEPFAVADTRGDPSWAPLPQEDWIGSTVKAPIRLEQQIFGILHLDSAAPNAFSEADAGRLQAFADQVAIAIHRAQAFAAEREQRTLAEALSQAVAVVNSTLDFDDVLDRLLLTIERIAPHDTADILLIEDGVARVVRTRPSPYEKPELQWALETRLKVDEVANLRAMVETQRPLVIADTREYPGWICWPEIEWLRSQAAAPIAQGDEVIGFLTLNSHTPGFFTPEQGERLQAFADQAAVALKNAQLFKAVQQHLAELDALRRITLDITGQLDLTSLLQAMVERAMDLLQGQSGGVYLVREDLHMLEWVVRAGPSPIAIGTRLGYGEGLSGRVWAQDKSLIVEHYGEWEGRAAFYNPDYHLSSVVGVPIKWGEEFLGVIVIDALVEHGDRHFTEGDAHLLGLLANQAAIAIKNARLFEEIHSHAAQLEQRVRERTAELEAQRSQLQTILDALGEGVVHTIGPQIVYTNQAFCDLFGFTPDAVLTRSEDVMAHIFALVEGREQMRKAVEDAIRRGESWRDEMRLQRKDGSAFDAAMTATQVPRAEPDRQRGTVIIFRDISQQKALQDQKDRFIASASHELRTPLANIKTRLYLIQRQPDQLQHHLAILERVTNNMTELIENLLDVSRFERGIIPLRRQRVVLQDLIRDVVSIQQAEAEHKDVALVAHLPAAPLAASIDPQRIAQVITNLIVNAINYTPPDGQVTIDMARDGDRAVIRVRDTGIGIEADTLEHVFEPFFRANQVAAGGTGLGLTIAREIVTLHGGEIAATSEAGQGSTFTVKLDLEEAD